MRQHIKSLLTWLSVSIMAAMLSGCILTNSTYKDADDRADKTRDKIHQQEAAFDNTDAAVVKNAGFYVNTTPVKLKHDPAWLNRKIDLQAKNMPLDQLINRLLAGTNVNARFDNTVQPKRLVTLHYRGSVRGALDTIEAKTHYYYVLDEHTLSFSAFETQTFNIAFMPGTSNYLVGKESGDTNSQQNQDQNGDVHSNINDDQYSNMKGQLSVWEDLQRGLRQLKSQEGTIVVSEATTSVTVHDHPDNVSAMTTYINHLNKVLSQQVAIKVEVLDVTLNKGYNLGINWDAIVNTLDTQFNIKSSLASATNVAETSALTASSASAISSIIIGDGEHQTFINALSEQGKLNVVTRPQVVTLNNQIASIRITTDTAYVKNVSTTVINDGGTTSSIEPGTVTEGFTLYVLPKIREKDVFMQISSTLSDILAIKKEDNAPEGVDLNSNNNNGGANSQNQYVAVQVPTLSQKVFNQRSVVRTGHTLVIAGYKRLKDQTDQADFFGVPNGRGAQSSNVETLVLITPVILRG